MGQVTQQKKVIRYVWTCCPQVSDDTTKQRRQLSLILLHVKRQKKIVHQIILRKKDISFWLLYQLIVLVYVVMVQN
jgi:hypothetical protein